MIFDDNTAYQLYRIFVAIFGTLGMVVATSPMKKNYKKNMLFLGGYAIYAVVFTFFWDSCPFSEVLSLLFLCRA